MVKKLMAIATILLLFLCILDTTTAVAPIIGILSHPYHLSNDTNAEYIASSYVKWLESAGASSIPIPYHASPSLLQDILSQVDGVLFPGGSAPITPTARTIWKLAKERNQKHHVFPMWGTCLGFQYMLMMAAEQDESLLKQDYDAENFAWPLLFPTEDNVVNSHGVYSIQSQLYNTSQLRYNLQEFNMTFNAHKKGLQPQTFIRNSKLTDMFYITSTNYDAQMQPFVSTMEAKDYPFYGVQYHPEKNNFEYGLQPDKHDVRRPYEDIPHSMESVQLSLHLALFFVNLARNDHGRYSKIDEYPPIYTYPMVRGGGKFEHVYLVPSAEHWGPDGMEPESPPLHNKNSLLRGGNTLLPEEIA